MRAIIPTTIELARQLAAAHEALHIAGMRAVSELPGDPYQIDLRRFGRATAMRSRALPIIEWYNRVVGLEQQDARALPEMLAFFREVGIRGRFEIGPAELTNALAAYLALEHVGVERLESMLFARADELAPEPAESMHIEEAPLAELEPFLDIWARGFALPDPLWRDLKRIRSAWFSLPEFRRYVAFLDGRAVAIAGLYLHGDVAYLCESATLPEARGRGAQTALIARRWRDALALGSRWVLTTTAFGGTSQHNMERAGMRLALTYGIWLDYGMPF